jgi:Ser/Thr protein kinase RdoA (MazF antagonist)
VGPTSTQLAAKGAGKALPGPRATSCSLRRPLRNVLTPDVVLDALASVGLYGDGRLLGLSSYENRVYQIHLEDPFEGNAIVVAKFYRPGRWSEAQILEEHASPHELEQAEVPAVAPLAPGKAHAAPARRLFLQRVAAPRRPRARAGRRRGAGVDRPLYLARLHTVGSKKPFETRPAIDVESFGDEPRDWLLAHNGFRWTCRRLGARLHAGAGADPHRASAGARRRRAHLRLHGDCHPGNILWTPDAGPHFVDLDDARTGPAVQDLWMLLSGERAQRSGSSARCSMATSRCATSTATSWR